jgi:predicted phage tail component-like protein
MDFIQPTESAYDLDSLPSESLIINGTPMEELVPGFRTLSVGGRELRGRNINAINRQGNDGAIFLDSKLEPRVLPVRYKLTAQDNAEFRYLFNKMNALLQREQLSIRVLDEPEYSYTGTLESVSDVPQGRNIVVSDLTLFCADPYKYKDAVTVNGTNTVDILMDTFYDTYPQEITITPTNSTSTLTIRNGNKEIKLVDGSFVGGQPVVIRFGDDITVTNQNGSMTDKIALHSDLENFTLNKGDTVQFVEGGQISIKVSQVML